MIINIDLKFYFISSMTQGQGGGVLDLKVLKLEVYSKVCKCSFFPALLQFFFLFAMLSAPEKDVEVKI